MHAHCRGVVGFTWLLCAGRRRHCVTITLSTDDAPCILGPLAIWSNTRDRCAPAYTYQSTAPENSRVPSSRSGSLQHTRTKLRHLGQVVTALTLPVRSCAYSS